MKKVLPFCFILLLFNSCWQNKNRLNTDVQKLAAQIETEEQEKQEAGTFQYLENQVVNDTFSLDVRYTPERMVDQQNPPEIIDIAGNTENIKAFKLSDIANSIQYIRLQQTTDSTFWGEGINDINIRNEEVPYREEIPLSIVKNTEYIIAYNQLGMLLYNSDGELLKTICGNELTGFAIYKNGIVSKSGNTFKGANGTPRLVGDKLYYNYEDDVNKIARMMEVDCDNLPVPLPGEIENQNQIKGIGNPVAYTGENSYSAVALSPNLFSKKGHPSRHEDMFTIYNENGDTLCSFPGNQKIENYTYTVSRTPDWGTNFTYNNFYYFREAHSDTIFKVVPPNKLVPAFIINLGEYKVENIQNAMAPDYDLSDKFLPQSIAVTDDYVLIRYTQGYDSPNNRKAGKVKFFFAMYNRKTKELWHAETASDNSDFALENDLDGGLPVWPGAFLYKYYTPSSISENGEIVQSIKGEVLKEYINSEEFKNSTAPANKKQELEELAHRVGKYESIVVVIK